MLTQDRVSRTALVVGHFCPFPAAHGNRRRLLSFFAWLRARGLKIVFVLQPMDVDHASSIGDLADVVDHYIVTREPSRPMSSFLRRLPILWRFKGSPSNGRDVDRVCWPTTVAAVESAVRIHKPLVLISEYPFFSTVFRGLSPRVLKVIDTIEVFQRGAVERQRFGFTTPFSAASEAKALNRADVIIAIQHNEARALRHLAPTKRVVTVEHPYVSLVPRSATVDPGVILYVASSNEYNRHGLQMFLQHAWPAILRGYPEATLHVIGDLTETIMGTHGHVVFRGRVTDTLKLAQLYASAHVVINPQVSGTGLKIKSVEAISAGCAVVMNAAGADGIEEGMGTAFLVAADWKEFAQDVLGILTDDATRLTLERSAVRFASQRFSMTSAFEEFGAVLDQHETRVLAM